MKTSPWGKKQTELEEPIVSFVDIMSEELAEQLEEVCGCWSIIVYQLNFLKGFTNNSS